MIIDNIDWETTGENRVIFDEYSYSEMVRGSDEDENQYIATGIFSVGDLVSVKNSKQIN